MGNDHSIQRGWLAEEVDDRVLRVAFIPFGDITDTHIPLDYETGESPQRLMFRCLMPGKNLEKLLSHVHSVYGWYVLKFRKISLWVSMTDLGDGRGML